MERHDMAKSPDTQKIEWTCLSLGKVALGDRDSSAIDPADQECVKPEEENKSEVVPVISPPNRVASVCRILVIPVDTLVHHWAVHC